VVNRTTTLLKRTAKRVLTHPRPWILRYLILFVPALVFAVIITLPLWQNLPYPVIRSILDQREIDIILDALLHAGDGNSNLLLPLVLTAVACLVWLPVQIASLWLEGGTLFSYTSAKPITWKVFFSACNRWFGFLLLFQCLSALVTTGILITTVGITVMMRALWTPLMWLVICCGMLLILYLSLWFETARAVAVTRNDKHVGHSLRDSARFIIREPAALSAFYIIALAGMAVLLLFQRWIASVIPASWWLLSLIVLQGLAYTRHGLRLFRRSGEVLFAQTYCGNNRAKNLCLDAAGMTNLTPPQ